MVFVRYNIAYHVYIILIEICTQTFDCMSSFSSEQVVGQTLFLLSNLQFPQLWNSN